MAPLLSGRSSPAHRRGEVRRGVRAKRGDDGDGGGDEDGALRAPLHRPPPRTLLGRLLRCCACLGAPGPKRTASSAPSRSVHGGGRLSLRAACAAVCSGLRSAALFPCLELEPNRVCNTRALAVKLPLRPPLVCALKFVASLLLYFSQPDDFFFLFVAFGQILETGSFRSCGPVAFFCFLFCTFEALAAYSQVQPAPRSLPRAACPLQQTRATPASRPPARPSA